MENPGCQLPVGPGFCHFVPSPDALSLGAVERAQVTQLGSEAIKSKIKPRSQEVLNGREVPCMWLH